MIDLAPTSVALRNILEGLHEDKEFLEFVEYIDRVMDLERLVYATALHYIQVFPSFDAERFVMDCGFDYNDEFLDLANGLHNL